MKKITIPFKFLMKTKWRMLFLIFFLQIFIALVGRSIAPLGVLIEDDLNLTKAQIGFLPAAFFLGQSLISIPSGILTDQLGTKRMLFFVTVCTGTSFIIATYTTGFLTLLILLFFGGVGYGSMQPASNRGIFLWFSSTSRGSAMGIKQTGVTLGSALAAIALLPLSKMFGWRSVLLITSIFLLVFGLVLSMKYKDPSNESFDKKKYEFKKFLLVLKNKALILLSFSAMGLSAGQMILNTYIVLFAYEYFEYPLFLCGLLLVISEISGSFGRVLWGIISDKIFKANRHIILTIIAIISGLMSLLFTVIPVNTPYWVMVILIIILGFSISGFNGIWMNTATEVVSKEFVGTASGVSLTLGVLGAVIGPPVFGFLFDLTNSYLLGWIYLSILMSIVLLLLVKLKKNIKI